MSLQEYFNVPLAILSVESYKGDGVKNKRGASNFFKRSWLKQVQILALKFLLVDDLADSGITLKKEY